MPFLRDMSACVAGVWDYISPRKTQKRREKPFKVPALPARPKSVEQKSSDVTPDSRILSWTPKTPASASSVDDTLFPPSPPMFIPPDQNDDHDFDGTTLIQDSVEQLVKDDGADVWDANQNTMVVDDGQYMDMHRPVNHAKEQLQELLRQEVQSRELRLAAWPEDAVFLFRKLDMRGSEPILPHEWSVDFPSLPPFVFTTSEAKQFVRADTLSEFRAQYALTQLLAVGGLARDAVLTCAPKRTAERHILRAVNKYSQWAMRDSGMRYTYHDLSVFDTVSCHKDTPSYIPEQKMIRKLYKIHGRWKAAMLPYDKTGLVAAPEELPTLYGVIASHTVMAFVSYVVPTTAHAKGSLRTIAIFDFGGDEGFDVWNSFAIAIFVIHCRNRMKELQDFLPKPVVVLQRDPDL